MRKRKQKRRGGMEIINGKLDRILFGCMGFNFFCTYLHRRLVIHGEGAWYFLFASLIMFDSSIRNAKDPRFRRLSLPVVVMGGVTYSLLTIWMLYVQFCTILLIAFVMEIVLIGKTYYNYYYKD